MRDYSERRQSSMVSPKKRPSFWPYVFFILLLTLVAFGAGFGTGWYLYRPGGKLYKVPQTPQPVAAPKQQPLVPPQGQPITPAKGQLEGQPAQEKGTGTPPLTFYKTLQKGNKELMGTGINQPKVQQQNQMNPTSTSPPGR